MTKCIKDLVSVLLLDAAVQHSCQHCGTHTNQAWNCLLESSGSIIHLRPCMWFCLLEDLRVSRRLSGTLCERYSGRQTAVAKLGGYVIICFCLSLPLLQQIHPHHVNIVVIMFLLFLRFFLRHILFVLLKQEIAVSFHFLSLQVPVMFSTREAQIWVFLGGRGG